MAAKYKKSHCLICGMVIYAYRSNRYTCGSACEADLKLVRKEAMESPRECMVCGNIFYAKRLADVYCSSNCKIGDKKIRSEFTIFQRDKYKCIYCGKSSIEDGVKLNIEHITAIGSGGKSEISNLVTSCERCNSAKGVTELPVEIKQRIFTVLSERNGLLSKWQIGELTKEIDFYRQKDSDRWMKISFKRRNAINKLEYL